MHATGLGHTSASHRTLGSGINAPSVQRGASGNGILTLSLADAVVDGDVFVLLPVPARQCAVVARGCVAVQHGVIWDNDPTLPVRLRRNLGPFRCEIVTIVGWRVLTVGIIAPQPGTHHKAAVRHFTHGASEALSPSHWAEHQCLQMWFC